MTATTTPTTRPALYRTYLPVVQRHVEVPFEVVVPVNSQPIEEHPVTWREVFATSFVDVPADLPRGGAFYLSSSATEVQPSRVDDRIVLKVDGAEVFSYTYGVPPENLRGGSRQAVCGDRRRCARAERCDGTTGGQAGDGGICGRVWRVWQRVTIFLVHTAREQ